MDDLVSTRNEASTAREEWKLAGIVFFGLVALVLLYETYVILRPFIAPLILGAVLATIAFPLFLRVRARLHNSDTKAGLVMIVLITIGVILPVLVIIFLLVQQANTVVQEMRSGEVARTLQRMNLTERLPWLQKVAPGLDLTTISPQRVILPIAQKAPAWIAEHGTEVVGGIAGMLIGLFLVLLSTYFFFVEGDTIGRELRTLSPLPARYNEQFAHSFKGVIDATFRGQVVTSLSQGAAAAVGFWIAGVPGAILWGAVTTIASLLPVVGAAVVWVPAIAYLFVSASIGARGYFGPVFLLIWGAILVPILEHIVRPWAMKGKTELPAIPLLISVLGGMEAFGFIGLVVGPLVFSLLTSVIDIYKRSFGVESS
jgi:predicted PurR-regulated permease PerM